MVERGKILWFLCAGPVDDTLSLTVNLGMRYELLFPYVEMYKR